MRVYGASRRELYERRATRSRMRCAVGSLPNKINGMTRRPRSRRGLRIHPGPFEDNAVLLPQPRQTAWVHTDRSRGNPQGRDAALGDQPVHRRPADSEPVGDLADGQEASRTESPVCPKRD
jgi:hypothetical protein